MKKLKNINVCLGIIILKQFSLFLFSLWLQITLDFDPQPYRNVVRFIGLRLRVRSPKTDVGRFKRTKLDVRTTARDGLTSFSIAACGRKQNCALGGRHGRSQRICRSFFRLQHNLFALVRTCNQSRG